MPCSKVFGHVLLINYCTHHLVIFDTHFSLSGSADKSLQFSLASKTERLVSHVFMNSKGLFNK